MKVERYKLTDGDHDLIKRALAVLEKNFDDGIYNHTVGCAIRCKDGRIYEGVNCDGIHGSCAEYITMGIAISAGERDFDTIVAVHEKARNSVVSPCGNCRQMLFEYCPDILVIVNDEEGNLIKVRARELLPFAWEPIIC
jgi:cytidine deaminase